MSKSLLIIFVKNPELGKVKTRLAASVGDETALAIYYQLLRKTREVTEPIPVDKVVYYSERTDPNDLWENDYYQKACQQGADLGERMKNAFQKSFSEGYERVCIIGSDCMEISSSLIKQAFEKLQNSDAVIGPSQDGGYYLLGMNQFIPQLFENKAWSTDAVFSATLDDLNALSLNHCELPVLSDIDTAEDLGDWFSETYQPCGSQD